MRGTDLREPSRLLLLQIKAEAGICSVLKSSSSAEVRVGLAGGAGKQEAGVRIAVSPELVPSPLAERFTCVGERAAGFSRAGGTRPCQRCALSFCGVQSP